MDEPPSSPAAADDLADDPTGATDADLDTRYEHRARDAQLVGRVQRGDSGAFGELYDAWFDRVFDLTFRIMRDRELAAEVTQDTFLSAWKNMARLRDPNAFGGWLLRIARNGAFNRSERERRASAVDDQELAVIESVGAAASNAPDGFRLEDSLGRHGDPERAMIDAELQELVWESARALGPRDAEVLDLQLRHGLTPAEVGEVLGMNRNAANQLVHRVRGRLDGAVRARVLWRGGNPKCEVLERLLLSAGITEFDADAAKLITRHADGCEMCEKQRSLGLEPAAMFAALPLLAAPEALKAQLASALQAAGVGLGGSIFGGAAGSGGGAVASAIMDSTGAASSSGSGVGHVAHLQAPGGTGHVAHLHGSGGLGSGSGGTGGGLGGATGGGGASEAAAEHAADAFGGGGGGTSGGGAGGGGTGGGGYGGGADPGIQTMAPPGGGADPGSSGSGAGGPGGSGPADGGSSGGGTFPKKLAGALGGGALTLALLLLLLAKGCNPDPQALVAGPPSSSTTAPTAAAKVVPPPSDPGGVVDPPLSTPEDPGGTLPQIIFLDPGSTLPPETTTTTSPSTTSTLLSTTTLVVPPSSTKVTTTSSVVVSTTTSTFQITTTTKPPPIVVTFGVNPQSGGRSWSMTAAPILSWNVSGGVPGSYSVKVFGPDRGKDPVTLGTTLTGTHPICPGTYQSRNNSCISALGPHTFHLEVYGFGSFLWGQYTATFTVI